MATSNQKLFHKYLQKMISLNKDKDVDEVYDALLKGKNSYLRLSHIESSHFDPSWIKVIEDVLYDLGQIVSNPRSVTMQDSNVVPVELAKKIDGESVRHLASHSQYIKQISDEGNVVPGKILSHTNEDNIKTYENRFIATFIRRLILFIEKRHQFVLNAFPLYQHEVLLMKNETVVNGQIVEIETKVRVRKEANDEVSIMAREYVERIKAMREYVTYYYNSPFMKMMKNEKDVRKPILQTNVIRKNPLYRHCYEVFTFLERFDSLGVTYKVNEDYSTFTEEELRQYNYLLLSQYLSLQDQTPFKNVKKSEKTYKPRILTSIDDEKFVYGPIYKGPIEFVRVDEGYRKYLASLPRNDLPERPNKHEKEFYKEDYGLRKSIKEELKEIDKLLARKYKDLKEFEKVVQRILEKRKQEEIAEENERLRQIREEEDRRIEAKRQEIIAAAKVAKEEDAQRQKEEKARLKAEKLKALEEEARRKEEEERLEALRIKEEQERLEQERLEAERLEAERLEQERLEQERLAIEAAAQEALNEEPQEEAVVEETPAVNEPVQEIVNEEPVQEEAVPIIEEESEPEVEQVSEPEPTPEPIEEVVHQEEVKEEGPVEEAPVVEEKPKPKRAPRKKKEHAPIKEEKPQEEIKPEEIVVEEKPIEKEEKPVEVAPKEKKPRAKKAPKPAPKPEEDILEKIPGKFIVKAYNGYYISDKKFSVYKKDAKIFYDFNEAKMIKARFGGKVIKL